MIRYTKIKDLKYQILKNCKNVITKDNTYYIETKNNSHQREKRYNSCEKASKEALHKSQIYKLDAPFNMKEEKEISSRNNLSEIEKRKSRGINKKGVLSKKSKIL